SMTVARSASAPPGASTASILPSVTRTVPPSTGSPSTGTTRPPVIAMLLFATAESLDCRGIDHRERLGRAHRLLERCQVERAVVPLAVDEERRGAGHGREVGRLHVLGHPARG